MVANIFIDGEIGVDTTLSSVRDQYNLHKNPSAIKVHINSIGGDVTEGYAIHDFLRNTGKRITTDIVGKCYSIATVIALAGDERLMSENSEFMIHNPWMGSSQGDSKHFRSIADELTRTELNLAKFYAEKTGASIEDMKSKMEAETYMDISEAKKNGFITKQSAKLKAVAKLSSNMDTQKKKEAQSLIEGIKKMLGMADKKALIETTLDTGTAVVIEAEEGEDLVGKPVFIMDEEGTVPAPDGTHTLVDGTTIEVSSGIIQSVMPPAEEAAPDARKDEEMDAMRKEMEALKAENASLKTAKEEIVQAKAKEFETFKAEHEKKIMALGEQMTKLNKLVIGDEAPKPVKKASVSENYEKPKHKFDHLIKSN